MRIAAIDYGRARLGIAITDNSKTIAYPLKTVKASQTLEKTALEILEALKQHINEIELIIIGLPLSLKGQDSKMALEVKEFAEKLKTKTNIPIKFIDERLTTAMAEKELKDTLNMNRKKRSSVIDPICATFILQNYLSQQHH
ncbi:MAG: Holliday junction resolvase RuvX [Parachlamydiales bacterium]|jgi:putative Holliday junction resolvase